MSFLRRLLPGGVPLMFLLAGVALQCGGMIVALAIGLDTGTHNRLTTAGATVGMFAAMPAAALFVIAAILEPRSPPRALIYGFTAVHLLVGGIITSSAYAMDEGISGGIFMGGCCYGIPILVLGGLSVMYAIRSPRDVRDTVQKERREKILGLLRSAGEVSIDTIVAETGMGREEAREAVRDLQKSGWEGYVDPETLLVCTAQRLVWKQASLRGLVEARGRVGMQEVCTELGISPQTLRDWIYFLVGRGDFTGFIDWKKGYLYGRAGSSGVDEPCPSCGARLELAGRGVVKCPACDLEKLG